MLNKIIAFSIRNKLIIGLFTIALIAYGIYETTLLPIDAVPDITDNQVQIITVASSFGATDIERLVTFPIEQANSNIHGIKEIRSFSRSGLSLVTIVFDDATDVYWARQQVSERLQIIQSEIPAGIGKPELGPITTGLGEIYQYAVKPKPGFEKIYSSTELRTIQDWIVRRQLIGVKGVAEVSSFGGKLKQYEIAIDPNKLKSFGLTINDVFDAVQKNNQNTGGAYIEKGPTVLFIRSEGLLGSIEEIKNVPVSSTAAETPVFIRDIAEVKMGHSTRYGAMCYNNEGEVAGAVVMMLKGANSSEVITNIRERVEQIKKTLPEGVTIEPFLDRSKMVNNAIHTVTKNLLEGALIVIFILVIFLGNLRAGLLVASVIPLSMLFAVILMNTFGVSGNLMSLGALDFGLIVDGAVIIVEAVMHQLTYSKSFAGITSINRDEMDKQVRESAGKMMNSAVFGQVIILIVYLPIFALQGIEGKMFKPMAQTVSFALIGAFLLSLTYIPMMSSLILSKKLRHKANRSDLMMIKVEKFYQTILEKILRFPKAILTVVILLFGLSIITLFHLGGEFIPALEEGDFAVDTRVLTGSNLNTTIEYTQKAAGLLKKNYPEVEKIVTKIGSGEVPTDPMPMEAADMMVILKDKKEWTSAKTFNELAEKMSNTLKGVPGITTGFQYPVQMRFNELMTGARQDVVCKIFGDNLDSLSVYAEKLGKIIRTVNGAQDLFIEPITGLPQVTIRYNRAIMAQYGLNIEEVNRIINTSFAGQSTGKIFEDEKRFDLVVRLKSELRSELDDIKNLLIPARSGVQIPLYQVANVEIINGPNQIQRLDAKRRIVVGFNVRDRDVQSIVNELQQKVNEQLRFSPGYYVNYGGAFENLVQAKKRLAIAVPVSLVLIFLLLFFAFNSIRQGFLIYSAIPLSAIGGIFFLALRGMPFSISAGIGFIALFGVAVLNGIVLIAEFNRLKASGIQDLHRIVVMGTKVRLRPVIMTALVASLGFLPMAISNGAGAEVQRPLATVVIGGLMLATLLTLFVLPVLYILVERKAEMKAGSKTILIILLLLSLGEITKAQEISLPAAIDSAISNNRSVRNSELLSDYRKALKGTYADIAKTMVTLERGQINSAFTDNRMGFSQSFSFPVFYIRERKLLDEEFNAALISYELSVHEIKKLTTRAYYQLNILKAKEKLLLHADSIYAEFVRKAEYRLNKGESNLLEKISAQTAHDQIKIQLNSLQSDLRLSSLQFRLLINTQKAYFPSEDKISFSSEMKNPAPLNEHPLLRFCEQEIKVAKASLKARRSQAWPDLLVGLYSQTLQGTGADNKFYLSSDRFTAGQLGLAIPLFFGAHHAATRAEKIKVAMAENRLQQQYKEIQLQLELTKENKERYDELIRELEMSQAVNGAQLQSTADKQFSAGEINYLEWTLLTEQSIRSMNTYYDALMKYNEYSIELQYLLTK